MPAMLGRKKPILTAHTSTMLNKQIVTIRHEGLSRGQLCAADYAPGLSRSKTKPYFHENIHAIFF